MKTIDFTVYKDKIHAGWIGKSIGGIIGAPYECHKQLNNIEIDELWPQILYPNDDLDIQVVWLEALQKYGICPSSDQLAAFWKENCFYVCCEYGVFINNLDHGINPPLSGRWRNEFFQHSEGCPIRSEIWGFISAGNPELAMDYAAKDGVLDHGCNSVQLEQFFSAAAALAFFSSSVEEVLEKACNAVPEDNLGAELCRSVKMICAESSDALTVWRKLVRRYGSRDSTNAVLNNAFAIAALLLAKDDFKLMMQLCIRFGWDCDCTAATAGALWGVIHGKDAFPVDWLEKMGKNLVCACDIPHKNASLEEFAMETALIGIEVARQINRDVIICNAPAVPLRPLAEPEFYIRESYTDDQPVLYSGSSSRITLTVFNPVPAKFSGVLSLTLPEGVETDWQEKEVELTQGANEFTLDVKRASGSSLLRDNYLFKARLVACTGYVAAERTFGLDGANRWLVYGPYWDMWDKDFTDVCPYQNSKLNCNPGNLPEFCGDAFNTHVRFRHEYLDEKRLAREDIPEEEPFAVEIAGEWLCRRDIHNFDGASVIYLVREISAGVDIEKVHLVFQATCPFLCMLDGKELCRNERHLNPGAYYGESPEINLGKKTARLVIKLVSGLGDFRCNLRFEKSIPSTTVALSPYVSGINTLL